MFFQCLRPASVKQSKQHKKHKHSSHSRDMSRDGCGLSGHAVSFPRNCRHFEEESHVGELLQAKGDPTLARNDGVTPTFIASKNGHLDCLRFLLEAGAGAPTGGRETTARPPRSDGRVCACGVRGASPGRGGETMTGLVENARLSICFEYFRSCSYLCLVFQVRFSVFLRFSRSLFVFLVFL